MEFNLNLAFVVFLTLLVVGCLLFGCRFSLREGLDHTTMDNKPVKCGSFVEKKDCDKNEDCSWNGEKCDVKTPTVGH